MKEYTATIGFFDGVHLGHAALLNILKEQSKKEKTDSMVISFTNHPRKYFNPHSDFKLLTNPQEKSLLIKNEQIDRILLFSFDEAMSKKTSYDFMKIMHDDFNIVQLIVGYDNHFGSDLLSSSKDYIRYGKTLGIKVICAEVFSTHGIQVSSSKIRQALNLGQAEKATTLLGHAYLFKAKIIHGKAIGRRMGIRTANLKVDENKLLPKHGVYIVDVLVNNIPDRQISNTLSSKNYQNKKNRLTTKDDNFDLTYIEYDTPPKQINRGIRKVRGVMNIGTRPTFNNGELSLEVHLINFFEDIYNDEIEVSLLHYIREEKKFENQDELVQQINKDVFEATNYHHTYL